MGLIIGIAFICFMISVPIQLFRRGAFHFELLKLMKCADVERFDSFLELYHRFGWAPVDVMLWFYSPVYYTSPHMDAADPEQVELDQKIKRINKYAVGSFLGMIVSILLSFLLGE